MISLARLKQVFEDTITKKKLEDAIGFTFDDLLNSFEKDQIKGLDVDRPGKYRDMIEDIANKKYKDLTDKQKDILGKVKVSLWDVVMNQSGGHSHAIINLTNLQFLGKGYVDTIKKIGADIVRELLKQKKS